jgi:hypothetical protein
MPIDNFENQTVTSVRNRSLAKRSRNLGIMAMSMMIAITVINFNWQMQWYSYDWAGGLFNLALFTALVLSIIGFGMGINALGEKVDKLSAVLGLVLNGIAFLPLCLFASFLLFARG